jgi:glutathione synthase/RimK-type ligase-like ATP-grasp enzyme
MPAATARRKAPRVNANDPFAFLFIEPEPVRHSAHPSLDAAALRSQLRGPLQPTGARDKILVLHTWPQRDVQTDELVAELVARGVPLLYVHTATFLVDGRLSLRLGPDEPPGGTLDLPSGRLALDEVSAVWCRTPAATLEPAPGMSPEGAAFARRETLAALQSLAGMLKDAFWVNPPLAALAAEDKLDQLRLARSLGLRVPRTLVTNDPREARSFYAACGGEVIVKTFRRLASHIQGGERVILTNRLRPEHLADLERVRLAPSLFQEYVPKDVELRVTVVGRRLFAVEIHSQQSSRSQDDYRRYDLDNTACIPATLPPALAEACLRLAEHFRLRLAAIDLIRRPDGEYVFLEINTSPQYLWIQDLTELPLRQAVADLLMHGPRGD